ncbi:TraB/GumN family protein [Rhodobacteraceae bacterium D3-12]|nr:TraB/GumN family protein [Rhodobacteraceae bacterium D3-12]
MPLSRFLTVAFLFLAAPLHAFDCGGSNLMPTLSPDKRAALEARAAAAPYPTGLFWQATRGDTKITIFGTYHFFHAKTKEQVSALLPHARAADVIYFEMSHRDTKRFEKQSQTDPTLMFITSGPTIPEMLDEADWQRLRTLMAERGIPSFMAAKFKPIFISMMLGSSPCDLRQQMSGIAGIDERLAAQLDADGLDTRSIEDTSTVVKLLDGFTREEQIAMIKLSLDLPQDPDDLQTTLLDLYFAENISLLWEFGRMLMLEHGGPTAQADFDKFERMFLTDRNTGWAELLDTQTAGKSVFVAVGAGHLPGKIGLLHMLETRGFAIKRLQLSE